MSAQEVASKVAALMQFPPDKREEARILLGLTQEQVVHHRPSVLRLPETVTRLEHRGSLTYPDGWPKFGTAIQIWTFLKGDSLPSSDPWNGLHAYQLSRGAMDVPAPEAHYLEFWGFDIRRDRLPIVEPTTMNCIALPMSKRTKIPTNRCVAVLEWLYPTSEENLDRMWWTIRELDPSFAAIIRELSKIVALNAVLRNSIIGAKNYI